MTKIRTVLSVHRGWLLDGECHPFHQKCKYASAGDLLHAIRKHGIRNAGGNLYNKLIFVLSSDYSASVAIFGHTHQEPYRLDRLLHGDLNQWDAVLLCAATAASGPMPKLNQYAGFLKGVIFESSEFLNIVSGSLHPGSLLELSPATSHWNEDIWDLDWKGAERHAYTEGYHEARLHFEKTLENASRIRSNADLAKHIEDQFGVCKVPVCTSFSSRGSLQETPV